MSQDGATDGAHQNIARAALTLDALARAGNAGLRLTDVARITGLSKTAAHRCLAGLVAHGLANNDSRSSLFYLGDRIMAWSELAGERFLLADRIKPYLQEIADRSGDTVYFSVRRGDEAVCIARAEGDYPIKTLTLNVGDRRPLGVGSGSLAIMSGLPEAEIERLLEAGQQSAPELPRLLPIDVRRTMLEAARHDGYALMDGRLIAGMSAIGLPVHSPDGSVRASLSIAAITERINPPRRDELLELLRDVSARVEAELSDLLAAL